MKTLPRSILLRALSGTLLCVAGAAHADVTYKCPGNNYFNSNTISANEAKAKGCTVLEGTPITVIQGSRPRSAASGASGGSAAPTGSGRIDPSDQRARDTDARRILEAELKREEDRLAVMKTEYNNGQPDRIGAESRNFQKYLDRVADMKAAITRKEGDIAALKRELLKYPQ